MTGQVDQRRLPGLVDTVEDRLPKERAAQVDAVKSADQLPLTPCLNAVGEPQLLQPAVGLDHFSGDPRRVAVLRAGLHHPTKAVVAGEGKVRLPKSPGEA